MFDPAWIFLYMMCGGVSLVFSMLAEMTTGRSFGYAHAFMFFLWPIGMLWLVALCVYRGFRDMIAFTREVTK